MEFEKNEILELMDQIKNVPIIDGMDENTVSEKAKPDASGSNQTECRIDQPEAAQTQPPRRPSELKARLRSCLETIIFGWLIIALCALLFSAAQWLASKLGFDFPIVPIFAGGMMLLLIALLLRKNGDDILTGMVDGAEEEDL